MSPDVDVRENVDMATLMTNLYVWSARTFAVKFTHYVRPTLIGSYVSLP